MKVEVKILLQTNMGSINNGWESTKWAETLLRKKGEREKENIRMDKSTENTLIYIYMYIHTHTHGHKTYIHINTHVHIYTLVIIQVRYASESSHI